MSGRQRKNSEEAFTIGGALGIRSALGDLPGLQIAKREAGSRNRRAGCASRSGAHDAVESGGIEGLLARDANGRSGLAGLLYLALRGRLGNLRERSGCCAAKATERKQDAAQQTKKAVGPVHRFKEDIGRLSCTE